MSYTASAVVRVTLIHNADAGDDDKLTPEQLAAAIEQAGHEVRTQSIQEDGWSEVLAQPAELVAVAGGDGTVGEVARRLVGKQIPIAVMPLGTANNIAKSLGLVERDACRLVAGWPSAARLAFDLGIATGPWGRRHFIEGVGVGVFTQAMPWITRRESIAGARSGEMRVADALRQLREHLHGVVPLQLNAVLDGRDIAGRYVLFEVLNTRYVGPNLFLAPDVAHGEGLLHVVGVTEDQREELAAYLADWQDGKTWPAELGVHTGRRMELEWTGYPVHLDDASWPQENDLAPTSPVAIELTIERAALQFLVPRRD